MDLLDLIIACVIATLIVSEIGRRLKLLERFIMTTKQEVLDTIAADFKKISDKLSALQAAADENGKVEAADLGDVKAAVDAATDALLNPPAPAA